MIADESNYQFPAWLTRLFARPKKPVPPPKVIREATKNLRPVADKSSVTRRRRHVPITRLQAERDLVTRLAFGETVAQQDDLVARWHVDKSTVSKWLKRWEGEGLIPARTQSGRCKSLAKA
jgi:hypothetical protein